MVWTLAIFWLVYWSFRLSKGRDLGGARRLWMVRVISAVGAFIVVAAHWLVVVSLVDALWPDLGYEGVTAILAEVTVILSGALIWGYLVPKGVYAKLGARSSSPHYNFRYSALRGASSEPPARPSPAPSVATLSSPRARRPCWTTSWTSSLAAETERCGVAGNPAV